MRLGTAEALAIDVESIEPSWERRAAADCGPWGRVAITAAGRLLTRAEVRPTGRLTSSVNVPLAPIADWWVRSVRGIAVEESSTTFPTDTNLHQALRAWNARPPSAGCAEEAWEDARYGWYARHFWLAGMDGAWLPDLAFVRADDRLWIGWDAPRFLDQRAPRFVEPPSVVAVDWLAAIDAVSDFVRFVATELVARGLGRAYPWAQEGDALGSALACPGVDALALLAPDLPAELRCQAQDKLQLTASRPYEDSAALLALRDLSWAGDTVDRLVELELQSRIGSSRPLMLVRDQARELRQGRSPEAVGYDAARELRRMLGSDEGPLDDDKLGALLREDLGASLASVPASNAYNFAAVAARQDGGAAVLVFDTPRTQRPWAQRMERARAAGHLLLDPLSARGVLGAGSSTRAVGPRRRRSGAFAAELLLPSQGIRKLLAAQHQDPSDAPVFEQIMDQYGVGARTAAHHLWNVGLLASPELRDALIDAYAAPPG